MEAKHHERCERNEGFCHDSSGCKACEAEHREELKRNAAPDLYEALNGLDVLASGLLASNEARCEAMKKDLRAIAKAEGR